MRFALLCVVGCLAPLLAGCGRGAPRAAKAVFRTEPLVAKVTPAEGSVTFVEADATRSAWKPSTQSARERPNKLSEFAGNVAEEIMIHQAQNWLAPTSGASPWPGTFRGLDYPYIIDVDPAGYAADAGVRPGDILLNYNGIDLASETSTNKVLYRAINQAAANRQQEVLIVVSRNGQVLVGVVPAGVRMGITYLTSR